jgi:hypothetical protein
MLCVAYVGVFFQIFIHFKNYDSLSVKPCRVQVQNAGAPFPPAKLQPFLMKNG